ncbi:MAG: ribonuclease P protein component [Chromatiales bacterium]
MLKPDDYRRVFSDGQRFVDRNFLVLVRLNGTDAARLGLAVSKKKLRRAVDRNLLKRLIRESFRNHQSMLAGLDVVVVNRGASMSDENGHYLDSLSLHWQRLAKTCKLS